MKSKSFVIIISILFSLSCFSQHKEYLSIGLQNEMKNTGIMRSSIVFSYENQLSKYNGFEIELSKRYSDQFLAMQIDNVYETFHVLESYLTLPVMYKFHSNIINISTGLSFDYFVGWNDITKFGKTELTSYKLNKLFYTGYVFKLSKNIPLTERFYVEPEIKFNQLFNYNYIFYGISMKLKYML